MHIDSVVYDGQPGQPSLVHTESVVYDSQPGQPSLVHTDSVVMMASHHKCTLTELLMMASQGSSQASYQVASS